MNCNRDAREAKQKNLADNSLQSVLHHHASL